jgi:hypothetical protein
MLSRRRRGDPGSCRSRCLTGARPFGLVGKLRLERAPILRGRRCVGGTWQKGLWIIRSWSLELEKENSLCFEDWTLDFGGKASRDKMMMRNDVTKGWLVKISLFWR